MELTEQMLAFTCDQVLGRRTINSAARPST
jgi:hypothetical protein